MYQFSLEKVNKLFTYIIEKEKDYVMSVKDENDGIS